MYAFLTCACAWIMELKWIFDWQTLLRLPLWYFLSQMLMSVEKLFLKELVAGEESKENRLPSRLRKKRQTQREAWDKLVDMEEEHVDIVAQKHLLMFVHAPTQFEVDEIISSMSVGFHEFEQKFEVVCALSFSPPKSLPNTGNEEFSYFRQFGEGLYDDNQYSNCGCLKTFIMALAQLFLYQSVEGFQFADDGQLVVVPEKSTT